MSLPWIKVYADLHDHPRALDLADALGRPLAWAHLVALWCWCSRHAAEGRIEGRNLSRLVERAAQWDGAPGEFLAAAVEVGWLEHDGEALLVVGWDKHQRAHLERAEKDAARKRQSRDGGTVSAECPQDVRTMSAGRPQDVRTMSADIPRTLRGHRVEDLREIEIEKEKREEQELATADAAALPVAAPAPALSTPAEPTPVKAPEAARQEANDARPEASPVPVVLAAPEAPTRRRSPDQPNVRTDRLAWLAEYRRLTGLPEAAAPDTRDIAIRYAQARKPAGRTAELLVEALRGALSDPWWRDKAPLQLLSESAITGGIARARAGPPKAKSHAAHGQVNDLWRDYQPTPTDTPAEWEAA
jgi:hypothetical protein